MPRDWESVESVTQVSMTIGFRPENASTPIRKGAIVSNSMRNRSFRPEFVRTVLDHVLASCWLLSILACLGWVPSVPVVGAAEKPVLSAEVPSINRVYDELKLVFDLAEDQKGFKTLKETLDVFIDGVETDKPCGVRVYVTADGLLSVASLPVRNEADFKKFLRNLWDLDLKTAPPPEPAKLPQVPAAVRSKVQNLKLQSNERVVFGLNEGFIRFESGQVHLGASLDAVRSARGGLSAPKNAPTMLLRIDGESAPPARRREAFEKAKEHILSLPKKGERESEAGFALKKAMLDYQLAKYELLFADSSQMQLAWTTSHEKKRANIEVEVGAAKGTSLAEDIGRIGQSPDEFAGVSRQDAVLAGSFNVPIDPLLARSLKAVVRQGREAASEKIAQASNLKAGQKAIDKEFVDLLFDVIDDVAGMSIFNGFVRTWSNADGTLTTVGAAQVSGGEKYREAVRKFKSRERVEQTSTGPTGVEIHKVIVTQWQNDYRELFDRDGSVFIGTSEKAVWYAVGANALERLEQSLAEAGGHSATKRESAVELTAEMRPLVAVWKAIDGRRPTGAAAKFKEKSEPKQNPSVAQAASVLTSLELPGIAVEAFQAGQDNVSLSLARRGDKVTLSAQFDAGTLRFVGKALSKFVKDNLED